jgi:O-acetyl-ADP-ribose deacetylase (regulator of RNase III)
LGGGGVDGAIHAAAGPELLEECESLGGCETGQAKITKGYGLPARYIIHPVGPVWHGGKYKEEELFASCYGNSLKLAQKHHLKTVAFPFISTGAYRFPIKQATAIAVGSVKKFLEENPDVFEKVTFVLFSDQDLETYKNII